MAYPSARSCPRRAPWPLTYGDHGSTFGGNALTTAAAAAGTRYLLDNDVLGNVRRMEVVLNDRLKRAEGQARLRQ